MTGDAESCKSICHGVGWPSPAHAAPALANTPPALAAIAAKRDNAFIPRPAPLLLDRVINRRRNNRARKNPNFARAATASCHGMTPPVWRVLSRGAMSLAGLAAIREFPVPPNHNRGLLQCTHDRSAAAADNPKTPINRRSWAIIQGLNRPSASHNDLTLIP